MGRIFLSAGHSLQDSGATAGNTTEAREMMLLRDAIASTLQSQRYTVLSVPDNISLRDTISWINARHQSGDIALEIHADSFTNPDARGTTCFYIDGNSQRRTQAELLLRAYLRRVPQMPSRGAKADTSAGVGSLAFCRQTVSPSLLLEVGFLTNPQDRFILQNSRSQVALGIAEGLAAWSQQVSGGSPSPVPVPSPVPAPSPTPSGNTAVNVTINNQPQGNRGIIVNGNAYIPVDLLERLGIDLLTYQGGLYVRVVDLREAEIKVGWNATTRNLTLRS